MRGRRNTNDVLTIISPYENLTPVYLKESHEVFAETKEIRWWGWASGSNYVFRVKQGVSMHGYTFDSENKITTFPEWSYAFNFRAGMANCHVWKGLIYDSRSDRLLVCAVEDRDTGIVTILVDRFFDSVNCPLELATLRKHVRAGIRIARQKGLRVQHVPQDLMDCFKLKVPYHGDKNLYGRILREVRENVRDLSF